MDKITIPENLARGHRGMTPHDKAASDAAAAIGAKWTQTFIDLGGLKADDAVLDIGCGPGRMAIAIGERFGWTNNLIGFEVRKKDINFCREAVEAVHPNFRFVHLDVRNMQYNPEGAIAPDEVRFPADDASIDFAFATSVFTHMFAAEVERYIAEAARVIRPGGTFFSTWFLLDDVSRRGIDTGVARFSFEFGRPDGTSVQQRLKPEEAVAFGLGSAQRMLMDAGFSTEFHRGEWSGRTKGRHSQDIIVARRG